MTFASPYWLLLLALVPLLAFLEWQRLKVKPAALIYSDVTAAAASSATLWARLYAAPSALRMVAVALAILALARPQERDVTVERTTEGINIMLVLDLSGSMMAQDFRPNRLEVARQVALDFVDGRSSDRVGLVVFAGRAYTQAPLTLDYGFLRTMIRSARIGLMEDGTAIGTAIATATARLRDTDEGSRVMILLTDGQNNRGEIDPLTAAELARLHQVRIYAVGMGTDGLDVMGRPIPEHLREMLPDDGVDDESLQAMAEMTGGTYFHAQDQAALSAIYAQISDLERATITESTQVQVAERYRWFLWPAFSIALLSVILGSTRLMRVP